MPGDNGLAIYLFTGAGDEKGNKQYDKNLTSH